MNALDDRAHDRGLSCARRALDHRDIRRVESDLDRLTLRIRRLPCAP
jgi:hypothetical protein